MRRALAFVTVLSACSPEPRSVAYFEAHNDEAARVAARCTSGAHRGQECASANAALAAAERRARMESYRRSF